MSVKLFFEAIIKYLLGVLLVGLLLFVPAGTINYFNGLLFMGLLFIPMFIVGMFMMIKDPNLLKSRLDAKEKEKDQKQVVVSSAIMFITGFVIAGFNYRLHVVELPNVFVIIGSVIFVISYILYAEVLRENSYLSRTIEVQKGQKVIDTGLYGIVRHPMYIITIFLFLSIPLILNSIVTFILFLIYPYIICKRIKNEEEVLTKELKGYKQYKKIVKYRLIPHIW